MQSHSLKGASATLAIEVVSDEAARIKFRLRETQDPRIVDFNELMKLVDKSMQEVSEIIELNKKL